MVQNRTQAEDAEMLVIGNDTPDEQDTDQDTDIALFDCGRDPFADYPLETEPCEPMHFKYTDPRDFRAPLDHALIIRMSAIGFSVPMICKELGINKTGRPRIYHIVNHGPNKRYVQHQLDMAWKTHLDGVDTLVGEFNNVLYGLVKDTRSGDPIVRHRARESYFKQLERWRKFNDNTFPEEEEEGLDGDEAEIMAIEASVVGSGGSES